MGSSPDSTKEERNPPGLHPAVHEEEEHHPGASDPVVMASFRTGIRDPDLLKKLARRAQAPESVKELFDMADRYASQEEAMAAENNDRPCQNQTKDNAESSKLKG